MDDFSRFLASCGGLRIAQLDVDSGCCSGGSNVTPPGLPMRKAFIRALTYESEPLSRVEMWLGIITLYLVISAFVIGQFSNHTGTADRSTVVPATNRA